MLLPLNIVWFPFYSYPHFTAWHTPQTKFSEKVYQAVIPTVVLEIKGSWGFRMEWRFSWLVQEILVPKYVKECFVTRLNNKKGLCLGKALRKTLVVPMFLFLWYFTCLLKYIFCFNISQVNETWQKALVDFGRHSTAVLFAEGGSRIFSFGQIFRKWVRTL